MDGGIKHILSLNLHLLHQKCLIGLTNWGIQTYLILCLDIKGLASLRADRYFIKLQSNLEFILNILEFLMKVSGFLDRRDD